ncbi:MAG: peptidase [Jaaginema sp. PMC 1078.18]|nr:peptidase [Jaaginema sp. PMC 1078.18]
MTGLPLPPQQTHSLPPLLNQWQVNPQAGDYFDQIQPTPAGYLIWSQFPVKVYLDPDVTQCQNRFSEWSEAILAAIAAWDDYFPLQVTQSPENANIIWQCQRPPLQVRRDRDSLHIPIARNAEARYHFYTTPNAPDILQHRIWIQLSPHQSNSDTQATARHELGHGLGIWGHSPLETDVMYDSQTRQNPVISPRDWNTLQRLYQQPSYSASKGQ